MVIAIIALLATIAFVALDPLTRFRDARTSRRIGDIAAILSAIKLDQVDRGGSYLPAFADLTKDQAYMISGSSTALTTGCNTNCGAVTAIDDCVSLAGLVDGGYLGTMPISPDQAGAWSEALTGYYLVLEGNNAVTVGACEVEGGTITSTR